MLTRKRLLEILEEGESLTVEFKQRFTTPEKLAKEMVAFANTRGGYILIGVDDDASIFGVAGEKSDVELITNTAEKFCEPKIKFEIQCVQIERKDVLIVEIPESKNKPHRIQDYQKEINPSTAQVYVRINDKCVAASKEMIKLLQTQTSGKSLKNYVVGHQEKIVFDYLDRNESITVKELSKHANISERRSSRTLIKLVRANLLLIHHKENGESYFTYAG
jgi:predicted HTH transcriptional regulator